MTPKIRIRARANTRSAHAKANPGIPLWPVGLGLAAAAVSLPATAGLATFPILGLTATYGTLYLTSQIGYYLHGQASQTMKSLGLYVSPVPVAAGAASYFAARRYSKDPTIQILGTVVGYGLGTVLYQPYYKQQTVASNAEWCRQHSFLANFSPSCSDPEVLAVYSQDAQDAQWCKDTPLLPWVSPSCYGYKWY